MTFDALVIGCIGSIGYDRAWARGALDLAAAEIGIAGTGASTPSAPADFDPRLLTCDEEALLRLDRVLVIDVP